MDTCVNNNKEKEFYTAIQEMIGELVRGNRFSMEVLHRMKAAYQALTEEKQKKSLHTVYEILQEHYAAAMYIMAVLLRETGDKKIVRYVIRLLSCSRYPLLERINDASQLRMFMFTDGSWNEYDSYRDRKRMYENMLQEIQAAVDFRWSAIPMELRKKRVLLVLSQLINIYHAPTRYVIQICRCLVRMGYEVECFICHFFGVEGYWDWKKSFYSQNIMYKTGPFMREFAEVQVKGYNFELRGADYIETLRLAEGMVWEKRPEYVLEIGSETILAGLCREFTTVVTMGMTGALPVTNAQIIASLVEASQEERALWDRLLAKEQVVIPVRFAVYEMRKHTAAAAYQKKDFGIPQHAFVIVIAGNRLDLEVKKEFEQMLFQLLDMKQEFMIAVIGECPVFRKRMLEGSRADRFCFLGHQKDFKGAIGIGDVFVNPPRQGGGTGGLFALMESVPVITQGGCDVSAMTGNKFVCERMEDMPALILRYFTDRDFMDVQKENCRREAAAKLNVDNREVFCRIHDAVKAISLEEERGGGSN